MNAISSTPSELYSRSPSASGQRGSESVVAYACTASEVELAPEHVASAHMRRRVPMGWRELAPGSPPHPGRARPAAPCPMNSPSAPVFSEMINLRSMSCASTGLVGDRDHREGLVPLEVPAHLRVDGAGPDSASAVFTTLSRRPTRCAPRGCSARPEAAGGWRRPRRRRRGRRRRASTSSSPQVGALGAERRGGEGVGARLPPPRRGRRARAGEHAERPSSRPPRHHRPHRRRPPHRRPPATAALAAAALVRPPSLPPPRRRPPRLSGTPRHRRRSPR